MLKLSAFDSGSIVVNQLMALRLIWNSFQYLNIELSRCGQRKV